MTWPPEPEDDWQDAVEDALATAWGRAAWGEDNCFYDSERDASYGAFLTDWFACPKKSRWCSDDR